MQKSLATQMQEITHLIRKQQKNLFIYLKELNNETQGGDFLKLSGSKITEMKDDDHNEAMNMNIELYEEISQER